MDVIKQIQQIHNAERREAKPLVVDGDLGPKTKAAVNEWWRSLEFIDAPLHDASSMHKRLGVDPAALKAVMEIESPQGAFERSTDDRPQGRPPILFEAHHFHKHTNGQYTHSHPHLSSPRWNRHLYTNDEHKRLEEAAQLNKSAAYKSASWGKYQILGSNYGACGFTSVQQFVAAMRESEQAQDAAFVNFIEANPRMHQALKEKDWATFARLYNGPAYKTHGYDIRLANAYNKHKERTA